MMRAAAAKPQNPLELIEGCLVEKAMPTQENDIIVLLPGFKLSVAGIFSAGSSVCGSGGCQQRY